MYYIIAYRADKTPILGNLDGQSALRVRRPERTLAWRDLEVRNRSKRVAYWQLEDNSGNVLATKVNPLYAEALDA